MFHYVYLLTFSDGMKYVGLHSTSIKPELDTCYLGSGKALPERTPQSCEKIILVTFPTRGEALEYEIKFIDNNQCVKSNEYYNLRRKTHDKHGSTLSKEHKLMVSQTHKGKPRIDYGLKYRGEGRTPAQRDGDRRAGEKIRGTKNPAKGRCGMRNNGFNPWYYITPDGAYHEVHDVPKQDYAERLGVTARQLGHRFHYTNEHKVAAKKAPKSIKGYTFGNLPRPLTG